MEFEDKNLKAVVQKAAKALKVPVETLQYEVLSYGSTGIFGLVGAKKAKIRVITPANEKKASIEKASRKETARKPKNEKVIADTVDAEEVKEKDEDQKTDHTVSEKDAIEMGRIVTQKIVDKITEEATVRVEGDSEQVIYHVDGGKTAVLIGKQGQTLEALQYIVERIVNKNCEKRIRLQIDVAGYLENRKNTLEQRALHLAEKVKKTGKPVTVGELNVYDRKVVHMSLKEDRDVRTQSMGSGFYRKLVIFPKKAVASKKTKQ